MAHPFAEEIRSKMQAYAVQWQQNAAMFTAGGDYEWMASFVAHHRRVLEVGGGVGSATLALLRHGHQVLSIDLNPWCLEAAEQLLRGHGFAVARPERSHEIIVEPDGWGVKYGPMPAVDLVAGTALLLSDVLTDDALPPLLEAEAPFDAICWWCPGAYGYRAGLEDEDKKRYRHEMRIALCHASQRMLQPGGVFHIVDRSVAAMTPEEHRRSLVDAYSAAATGTSLRVTHVDFRPVEALSAPGGIPMPHLHLPGGETGRFVLVSIVLQKK
jgi:hypothetical protein